MTQTNLFSANRARRSDPYTSKEAARCIAGGVTRLQQLVLDYVKAHRGTTDREMVEALRKEHGGSESTYRTRRAELVDLGLIYSLGVAEIGNGKHKTWAATPDAFR